VSWLECLDKVEAPSRHGSIAISESHTLLNPHSVMCRDVAPDEPPIEMRWLRKKPMQVPIVSKIT